MESSFIIETLLPVSLMIIMAGLGLTLSPADFRNVIVYPRGMLVGSVAQLFVVPALAFLLAVVLSLPPAIAVGLVVIAACPGGATSNVFAYLARSNVALSIVLTVIASLLTILTIPLFTNAAISLFMDGDVDNAVRLPFLRTVIMLTMLVVAPVALGMVIKAWKPGFAARTETYVSRLGLIILGLIIIVIVMQTGERAVSLFTAAGPACIALILGGIGLGFLSGRLFQLARADALTIAIEIGIKNGTIGMLVTLTLLESAEMAIAPTVYSLLMLGFGGLLAHYGHRRDRLENKANATSGQA